MKTKKKLIKNKQKSFQKQIHNRKQDSYFFKSNKPILVFLAKFFLIFIALEVLINSIDMSILTNNLTVLVANFFNLPYYDSTILVNSSSFLISNSCTGLVSLAILASITFPLKQMELKKRLGIVLAGAFLLLILNIPRIGLVIYAGISGFDAELVHELTWFLMSAVILLIWYFGIKFVEKKKDFSELI